MSEFILITDETEKLAARAEAFEADFYKDGEVYGEPTSLAAWRSGIAARGAAEAVT